MPGSQKRPASAQNTEEDIRFALWHVLTMPLYYKWPGYIGNALLLICGLIILFANSIGGGAAVIALAALNLYLIWKLDVFSREEVWLALELKKTKMREELLALEDTVTAHEKAAAATHPPPSQSKPH